VKNAKKKWVKYQRLLHQILGKLQTTQKTPLHPAVVVKSTRTKYCHQKKPDLPESIPWRSSLKSVEFAAPKFTPLDITFVKSVPTKRVSVVGVVSKFLKPKTTNKALSNLTFFVNL